MSDDVIELASPRRGHFELGTGYHGDLWLDLDGMFLWPGLLAPATRSLAGLLRGYQPTAVCGPLTGGAFLAQLVAAELGAAFLAAAPPPGDGHPAPLFAIPAALRGRIGGWRVALVDDAVNAGTAVRATCQDLRDAGAVPVAVAALLGLGPAAGAVTGGLGLPFHPLATLPSQVWPAARCRWCADGIPLTPPPVPGA